MNANRRSFIILLLYHKNNDYLYTISLFKAPFRGAEEQAQAYHWRRSSAEKVAPAAQVATRVQVGSR